MSLTPLITSLRQHAQDFPQEKEACDSTIVWIEQHGEFAFVKENLDGHLTASMMITNIEKTKVLLMFHKKYKMWCQFGGHCDQGETDTLSIAIREFHEESGIQALPSLVGDIFAVTLWDIAERTNSSGMYQPAHTHFDIMYLGIIDESIPFSRQESEVDDIRWFDIEGIENVVEEDMVVRIQKIQQF